MPKPPAGIKASATNLILYGPPGTGKTHWLRQKFDEYTETIESVDPAEWRQQLVTPAGWRAVVACALADRGGRAKVPDLRNHELVVAKATGRAKGNVSAAIWATLQTHAPEESMTVNYGARRAPFIFDKSTDGTWVLLDDWRSQDEEADELYTKWKTGKSGDADLMLRYRVVTFHPSFGYEDFVRGIRPVVVDEAGATQFRTVDGVFKEICDEARRNPGRRYALFIDEINRANIAKVFGELITLIEPDKRITFDENGREVGGVKVRLPGAEMAGTAQEPLFGVPDNLDLFGTMNTADRSIALLDIALRRRFQFREMEPDYGLLARQVEGVHLGSLLRFINDRLEFLLDRDHRIGHAYLMRVGSFDDLTQVFQTQIIPLLQEYFFDDLSKVALVLGGSTDAPLIAERIVRRADLFGDAAGAPVQRRQYSVTSQDSWTTETFTAIYGELGFSTGDRLP
jgi:5-methylcytosine-specific restriction protein B